MATNINIDTVTATLSKHITDLITENLDTSDKLLLLYIISKLSHLNKFTGNKFNINYFNNYIQNVFDMPIDHANDTIKILSIESISLLKESEFDLNHENGLIDKFISFNNENVELLLQSLVDYNIKSSVLWEKFEDLYKKNPIPNLSLYLLDSYLNYKRKNIYSTKILPLDIAEKSLHSIKGELSKYKSISKDDADSFLQLAKKYRQMIKGRVVKVEPCGLYVEISTNDKSKFIVGYVDIATFPSTFEERLDWFFVPDNHFHVRIINIPENYDNAIESSASVNQVFIKSNDNLISFEPANLDFDTNAAKKRLKEERINNNTKKSRNVMFSKGEMVNATTVVCHNTYEWALFKLQCLKTGVEAKKLGVLHTKNIRGDPIEKLRLLRKIEQGQPFKIKVTGTTGPLYSLNYSKMAQGAEPCNISR